MVNGVWFVTREALTVMQPLQYVLNWGTMTMLPTALYLSKYNNFIIIIIFYSSGTAWLDDVNCYYENCLSQCSGGSCPSSSVSCSYAANVTCRMSTILITTLILLLISRIFYK